MMSEYTPFSELTSEEKATYLGNASVTTFGAKVSEGDNINVNIPLSTLVPSAPVSDVTVNGSSVVSNGVAVVTVPTATGLAGDGLSVNGSTGKLDVSNKVPAPTATTDRGKVLTVNSSDEVVWDTPASSTYVKEDKGLTASGSYIGVECAGTGVLITDANGLYIKHDANDTGKFLTVGADNEITWGTPSGGSTNVIGGSDGAIYGSGAYCYVRTDDNTIVVNSQNQLHANFNIIDGSGSVIDVMHGEGIHIGFDTTGATVGDVLTVDQYGAHWAAPGGGGGGDSQIEYLDLTVEWTNDQYHLTAATKTLAEMSTLIQSGKQVIARIVKRAGSVITNITQIFIGDFYNGSPFNDGSAIWFGLGGSGSVPANTHYVTVTSMSGSVKWWSDLWEVSDIDEQ